MMTMRNIPALAGVLILAAAAAGCHKKVAVQQPVSAPVQTTSAPAPVTRMPETTPRETIAATPAPTPGRYPDAATRARIDELLGRIQDAYFDYNRHDLRPDAEKTLIADAKTLGDIIRQYPDFKLLIEGYADERGSDEFNLALGDARAQKTKEYLATLGLPANQMSVLSYGKEKPVCSDHTEDCWQKNRRTHVTTDKTNN